MKGIDVSKHQGKIDWQKVKVWLEQENLRESRSEDCDYSPQNVPRVMDGRGDLEARTPGFALIRAGYGMYEYQKDPCFDANMAGAKAAGIPVGVYWYSYALSLSEAIREAEICLEVIAPYKSQIVLPVAYDWEDRSQGAMTVSATTACCKAFLDRIAAAGYRPMLYSYSSWLQTRLQDSSLDEFPRWVAHFDVRKPVCSKPYIAWQYSSKGKVDGITGNVDLNVCYAGFFPTTAKGQWVKALGTWYWYENGAPVQSKWIEDQGFRYYLGPDGKMQTGVCRIDGKLYYFNESGREGFPTGAMLLTDKTGAIQR